MTGQTRIVLADDHPIVLNGLRSLIQTDDQFEVVGEATNGLAALKLILRQEPDIAILDISMPELNGIALTKHLADERPSVRVIALTLHEDRAYVDQAFQAGVRGYVLKRSLVDNLMQAIRAVARDGTYVDPAIAGQVIRYGGASNERWNRRPPVPLTPREEEVLRLIALGKTNKEIAEQLQVSIKSVETYKARGVDKAGLRTRADIVRYAAAQGWFAEL